VTSRRAHNFSAGPSAIPDLVLEHAREELLDWHGTGASILEMSHRDVGGPVQQVMLHAEARLRELLAIPTSHRVLFFHGGAHGQFAAVPLNLARASAAGARAAVGSYVRTGYWSERAQGEASKLVPTEVVADAATLGGLDIPSPTTWRAHPQSAYVHVCANETIHGLELFDDPRIDGPPLVADFTSTLLSRPVDVSPYGVIYASSGKNLGPAGVTVVIVRQDLLERGARPETPSILDWGKAASSRPIASLYNTPPVFALYLMGLVLDDVVARGGLRAMERRAIERATRIYGLIDDSRGLFTNAVQPRARSRMNIPFRVNGGDVEAERRFTREAEERGLHQLFGHPLFGGQRITLYNGVRDDSFEALVTFLEEKVRATR
jgi:phosphoserine aminotransferase